MATAAATAKSKRPGREHVAIHDGTLLVDGRPTFLYGGELQYFRVRAPDFDPSRTHRMWEESLNLMLRAGMNLVTTYVPWDYHNPEPGRWDFTGARDLARFLELVAERGMYLCFKPGPLITAEWPGGIGTFGAVPAWWKRAHPEALARRADGKPFSFSAVGRRAQRQPSYLHPTFLEAVREWYARSLAFARPYLGQNLVAVQVDNETNLYWGPLYGGLDYSDVALEHYRAWLERRYGTIDELNLAYSARYAGFGQVAPPTRGSRLLGGGDRRENPRLADWFEANQALCARYLAVLRGMIEAEGFSAPDVLLHTNDSPFGLNLERLPLRDILVYDGKLKNEVCMVALDLYPKQFLISRALQDQPFQTDYFTRLYDHHARSAVGRYAPARGGASPLPPARQATGGESRVLAPLRGAPDVPGFIFAAELQGGFWPLRGLGAPEVRPEATDQIMARSVGRGLKGGSFYVMRDGLNLDGSRYDYGAAIDRDGRTGGRYRVMRRWGRLLERHGARLSRSREIRDEVAILQHGSHAAPRIGVLDHMQRLHTIEQPAMFGWLANAGINPEVLDARLVDLDQLRRYRVVLYQNPDFVDDRTADLLFGYTWAGGALVNFLWPARENPKMARLFPATPRGYRVWRSFSRAGRLTLALNDTRCELESHWYASRWEIEPADRATAEPFLWERRRGGRLGPVVGYVARDQLGCRAFVGTNVYARFNQGSYYRMEPDRLIQASALARYLTGLGGVVPTLSAEGLRCQAWARVAGDSIFVFVINDEPRERLARVNILRPEALGLDAAALYDVTDAFNENLLARTSGEALCTEGLLVPVGAYRSAVVLLEPKKE
jgi:hypothetical protein